MKLDEESFQSLLSAAFVIQEHNARNVMPGPVTPTDGIAELLAHVPNFPGSTEGEGKQTDEPSESQLPQILELQAWADSEPLAAEVRNPEISQHLLREIVQQALQATHADGAAIAIKQQGQLSCREAAGDSAFEMGALVEAGAGLTGLCASSGAAQFCSNTLLDRRMEADPCRKLGVRAILVVPLFYQDQFFGVIAVFSRRPYAFGTRAVLALQDLVEKFTANLQGDNDSTKLPSTRSAVTGT